MTENKIPEIPIPPLETLIEEWKIDSKVDSTKLDLESTQIGSLHAKYLGHLTRAKIKIKSNNIAYAKLRFAKLRYYKGTMDQEELDKLGWEAFPSKTSKYEVEEYINVDPDLIKANTNKLYYEEVVDFCSSVIKELTNRTYQLGNAIKFHIFTGGPN